MAKSKLQPDPTGTENFSLRTLRANGEPPDCRISSAYHLWTMAEQLARDNVNRETKRLRIYKAVKRFPPTGYSKLAAKKMPWQSDVNWGQLSFLVNNQRSSFIDVITERQRCCEIQTKFGNEKERLVHSDNISTAFDKALREWPGYLITKEQSVFEMLVYGAGIGMWSQNVGWIPEHVPNGDLLFPENVQIDLGNMEEFVRRKRYTPYQLFKIIRNKEAAQAMGWCVEAVVDAIRYSSTGDYLKLTREELYRRMCGGDFNWGSCINQEILVYEGYWREFDGKISKGVVLQRYTEIVSQCKKIYSNSNLKEEDVIHNHGFLCLKENMFEDWDDILYFDLEAAGDVLLSEIKSLAEEGYVGARQYDFTMNSLIDAVRVNMMLLIQGGDAEATKKLKQMEWLPISILPAGTQAIQNRFQLPIGEALSVMQAYMGDLFRGIGQYRINAPTNRGGQRTKGEAELDAAEGAKLSGTQLKRYSESETKYYRKLYERFVSSSSKDDGYKFVQKFWDCLKEKGTPKEAAAFDQIVSIRANSLNGAGSPSMKMIVSEKLISITGMTAANEGQEMAIIDAIAALSGRDNVPRYRKLSKAQIDDVARIIGSENAGMTDALVNPANFPVLPEDRHIEHAVGHRADMQFSVNYAKGIIGNKTAEPEKLAQILQGLTFKGAHIMAHVSFIAKDPSKKEWIQQFMQGMGELEKAQDELTAIYKEMAKEEAPAKMSKEDIEVQTAASLAAIEVDKAQKMADISVGKAATSHAQRTEQRKEQAETQTAIQQAKGELEIEQINKKNAAQNLADHEANKRDEQQAGNPVVQPDSQ